MADDKLQKTTGGSKKKKPSASRYWTERHDLKNKEIRQKRHKKLMEKFAERRKTEKNK